MRRGGGGAAAALRALKAPGAPRLRRGAPQGCTCGPGGAGAGPGVGAGVGAGPRVSPSRRRRLHGARSRRPELLPRPHGPGRRAGPLPWLRCADVRALKEAAPRQPGGGSRGG